MPDYVSDLVNDAEALRAFLDYHIVSGRYDTSDLFAVDRLLTERGLLLDIHATLSRIAVGTDSEFTLELEDVGTVIGADIRAANGYVHSIDRVLFEPSVAELDIVIIPRSSLTLAPMWVQPMAVRVH